MERREKYSYKISTFYSPEAPFYWKLLKIGLCSRAKNIRKNASVLQVREDCPVQSAGILGSFTPNRAKGVKTFWR